MGEVCPVKRPSGLQTRRRRAGTAKTEKWDPNVINRKSMEEILGFDFPAGLQERNTKAKPRRLLCWYTLNIFGMHCFMPPSGSLFQYFHYRSAAASCPVQSIACYCSLMSSTESSHTCWKMNASSRAYVMHKGQTHINKWREKQIRGV